jgi:hypothetical protein
VEGEQNPGQRKGVTAFPGRVQRRNAATTAHRLTVSVRTIKAPPGGKRRSQPA